MIYPQINEIPVEYAKKSIKNFILEDSPRGDLTSNAVFDDSHSSIANILIKSDTVIAGFNLLKYFFDDSFKINILKNEGQHVSNGEIAACIEGSTKIILTRERIFLNLLQRMSAIAYQSKIFADLAKPFNVEILDTRKTTPSLRLFEKYSVHIGGACNHRIDLSSGIMLKDNHIKAAGGIHNAILQVKKENYHLPIHVEADSIEQIHQILEHKVDSILLDNFSRENTLLAVDIIRQNKNGTDLYIESSGGINLQNIHQYLDTGINAISIGALTHSIKAADISLDFL